MTCITQDKCCEQGTVTGGQQGCCGVGLLGQPGEKYSLPPSSFWASLAKHHLECHSMQLLADVALAGDMQGSCLTAPGIYHGLYS